MFDNVFLPYCLNVTIAVPSTSWPKVYFAPTVNGNLLSEYSTVAGADTVAEKAGKIYLATSNNFVMTYASHEHLFQVNVDSVRNYQLTSPSA